MTDVRTVIPSDTGASISASTGMGSPCFASVSKYPERASSAYLTAASYVFPHVWHPGSAGKYARYPSSRRSISSVYVSAFFSIDRQYTIRLSQSLLASLLLCRSSPLTELRSERRYVGTLESQGLRLEADHLNVNGRQLHRSSHSPPLNKAHPGHPEFVPLEETTAARKQPSFQSNIDESRPDQFQAEKAGMKSQGGSAFQFTSAGMESRATRIYAISHPQPWRFANNHNLAVSHSPD